MPKVPTRFSIKQLVKKKQPLGPGRFMVEIQTINPHTRGYARHEFFIDFATDEKDAERQAKASLIKGAEVVTCTVTFLGA